jgi:hypothetical protein
MSEEKKRGSYMPLWILIAVCALPYLAGTLYFQFKDELPQTGNTNYGQLIIPVRAVESIDLDMADGTRKPITDYRKKWLMLYVLDGACGEECQKNLYFMRQVRKAMAEERFRINRLLILERKELLTAQLEKLLTEFQGMDVAVFAEPAKARFLSTFDSGSGNIFKKIMVVDPLGNFMMEYDQNPDPERLLKDIKRLLAVSRIG